MSEAVKSEVVGNGLKRKKRFLGQQVPLEGDSNLYTQSWFPICLSDEVGKSEVKGVPFLGGRVIAMRGEDGVARVMSAYCAHLGADLSLGCVKGNEIECPYHFWAFDKEGGCTRTGAGDPPSKHASIFAFPTLEKHGLIWAFNGEEPLFDIPDWPLPAEKLLVDTQPFPVVMPIDPWMICAQTPDIQHVILLHKFELIGPNPEADVEWTDYSMFYNVHGRAQGKVMDIRAGILGSSVFFQTGTLDGRWFGFMTAMGISAPGETTLYSAFAVEKTGEGHDADMKFLDECRAHEIAIASEDSDIAQTIHFRVGALTKSDATLSRFLQNMRDYPRANPAADFIV